LVIARVGYLLLFGILLSLTAQSQSVKATVSRTEVAVGQEFELSFSYEMKTTGDVRFTPPNLGNFYVFSGPNESKQTSLVNMDLHVSGSFSYILSAKKEGTYEIPGALLKIDGRTFRTNSVKIIVKKGANTRNPQADNNTAGLENEIFIRTIVNKQSAYLGEQITVDYKLYFNPALQPDNPNYVKLPTFEGFWAEELDMPGKIMLDQEFYNGRTYYAGVVKTAALFATKTGTIDIAPLILTIPVNVSASGNPNDPLNDPFFRNFQKVDYKMTSSPVKVEILPIPADLSKINFSGGTGSFDIKTSTKKRVFKKNEPIRFEIVITGRGNIELVDAGKLEFDKSFEVLDPNIDKKINRQGIISGSKTIEYVLIPRDGGKYTLPSVEFNYFDLETKTIKTIKTEEIPITVSADSYNQGATGGDTEGIDIYTGPVGFSKDFPSYPTLWLISFLFLLPAAGTGIFIKMKKREEERLNDPLLKIRRAAQKIAKERLAKASALMNSDGFDQFYTETATALEGYLETKYKLQKIEFTSEKVYSTLVTSGTDETLALEVKKLLDECEMMRFAPVDGKRERMKEFYDRTSNIILKFEGAES